MSRQLLIAVGGGVLSAVLFLTVVIGSMGALILAYLAPLPLFLCGLGLGTVAAIAAGTVATALVGIVGGVPAFLYAALVAVPATLVSRQALLSRTTGTGGVEWYPPGLLVGWLTAFGAMLLLASGFYFGLGDQGLEMVVRRTLDRGLDQWPVPLNAAEQAALIDTAAPFLPGATVVSGLLMVVANGALAQGLLVRFGRNLRPSPDLATLVLPDWVAYGLAAALAAGLLADGGIGYAGRNLAVVLGVPFLFLGLAVVHAAARQTTRPALLLAAFYGFLLLFGWAMMVVAGLGFVEHWAGLRQRIAGRARGRED